jgi:hypothetical protein
MLFLKGGGLSQGTLPAKSAECGGKPRVAISTWTGPSAGRRGQQHDKRVFIHYTFQQKLHLLYMIHIITRCKNITSSHVTLRKSVHRDGSI